MHTRAPIRVEGNTTNINLRGSNHSALIVTCSCMHNAIICEKISLLKNFHFTQIDERFYKIVYNHDIKYGEYVMYV